MKSEWVSTWHQWPEEGKEVIACDDCGFKHIVSWHGDYWIGYDKRWKAEAMTHWMPAPEDPTYEEGWDVPREEKADG